MSAFRALAVSIIIAVISAGGAEAEIRIAVAGPMTGSLALLGAQLRAGAEAAVRMINEVGGVLGQQIVLEIADDTCSEDRADAVANQLAGAGVVFVAGHLCSAPSIAAAAVYAAEGIVQIAPGAPDPRFTEERPGPGIFRIFGREDEQGQVAAQFLAAQPADARIAIIDDRSPFGRRLTDTAIEQLAVQGRQPDHIDFYSVANPSFDTLVTRLIDANIEIIYVAGGAKDVATLRLEMARSNYRPLLLGGDTLADEVFLELAGDEANGTLFTFQPDPRLNAEAVPAIIAINAAGDEADGFTLYAFAAIELWAAAVEQAGIVDFAAITEAIATGTFGTVLGTIGFNEIGDANRPGWVIYQWRDGTIEYYNP